MALHELRLLVASLTVVRSTVGGLRRRRLEQTRRLSFGHGERLGGTRRPGGARRVGELPAPLVPGSGSGLGPVRLALLVRRVGSARSGAVPSADRSVPARASVVPLRPRRPRAWGGPRARGPGTGGRRPRVRGGLPARLLPPVSRLPRFHDH